MTDWWDALESEMLECLERVREGNVEMCLVRSAEDGAARRGAGPRPAA